MTSLRLVFALGAMGCGFSIAPPAVTGDGEAGIDARIVELDAAPDAGIDPADGVAWFTWPEQQPSLGIPAWGGDLIDVARHLPAQYGNTYWATNPVTAAHETSHGIQAHLRNHGAPSPTGWNAFYVLGDRVAFVKEPAIRKSDIKPRVPGPLRGPRFELYLVQQTAWDDTPLYVFDEWNAYANGAEVAIQQVEDGLWTGAWQDAVMGPVEFTAYAIATAQTIAELDPDYFATELQFKRFTAWNIARAMALFEQGRVMTQFAWDRQDAYAIALRTNPATAAVRQFARDTWGAAWTQTVLGF